MSEPFAGGPLPPHRGGDRRAGGDDHLTAPPANGPLPQTEEGGGRAGGVILVDQLVRHGVFWDWVRKEPDRYWTAGDRTSSHAGVDLAFDGFETCPPWCL